MFCVYDISMKFDTYVRMQPEDGPIVVEARSRS